MREERHGLILDYLCLAYARDIGIQRDSKQKLFSSVTLEPIFKGSFALNIAEYHYIRVLVLQFYIETFFLHSISQIKIVRIPKRN